MNRLGLFRNRAPEAVKLVGPASRGEISENFGAIRQMHERSTDTGLVEVTIAELEQARVLFATGPAQFFKTPLGALDGRRVAIMSGEKERGARHADAVQLAKCREPIFPTGNLHQTVEEKKGAGKSVTDYVTLVQARGVGMEETDGMRARVCAALGGEAAGLVDEFIGKIEGGERAIAEGPERDADAAGAAAGLEERGGAVGKEALDELALGSPETEFVRGAGVVHDRDEVVEIGADGRGGYFFQRRRRTVSWQTGRRPRSSSPGAARWRTTGRGGRWRRGWRGFLSGGRARPCAGRDRRSTAPLRRCGRRRSA